jgi:hypothetical protein
MAAAGVDVGSSEELPKEKVEENKDTNEKKQEA